MERTWQNFNKEGENLVMIFESPHKSEPEQALSLSIALKETTHEKTSIKTLFFIQKSS